MSKSLKIIVYMPCSLIISWWGVIYPVYGIVDSFYNVFFVCDFFYKYYLHNDLFYTENVVDDLFYNNKKTKV